MVFKNSGIGMIYKSQQSQFIFNKNYFKYLKILEIFPKIYR